MTDTDPPAAHRTLGNEDIHVHYRNNHDLVRHAIEDARSRAVELKESDALITLPVASFRSLVSALRMTFKTLGETIHQEFGPAASPSMEQYRGDRGAQPERRTEQATATAMVRFNTVKPRVKFALERAALYTEQNENFVRRGDEITVPSDAFQDITTALIESNDLMMTVLSDPNMLEELGAGAIPGPPPDHGDYGAAWDPWNYGNWYN